MNDSRAPSHLLDDLESIRALLGDDDDAHSPVATRSPVEAQIPLLFDVVGERRVPVQDDHTELSELAIPLLLPALAAPPATLALMPPAAPEQVEIDPVEQYLFLEAQLRQAAPSILKDVLAEFSPHIEAELRRRLDARLEALIDTFKR